jgi:hypothetical protein
MTAADAATIPVTSANRSAAHGRDQGDDATSGSHARRQAQPGRGLAEHALELRFHSAPRDSFHQSQLDALEQLAPLPGEVGNRLTKGQARIPFELTLHCVLQLRPKPAQIGLEKLKCVLDLGLNQLPHLRFEVGLKFFLPFGLAKDQPPGAPEGKIALKQMLPFGFAAPASLLDPAQKTADLSQGLLFALAQDPFQPGQLLFVAHDRVHDVADAGGAIEENHGRGLTGGDKLGQAVSRFVDHLADMLLERLEPALLPESFLVHTRGASEESFPARDRKNRWRKPELLVSGIAQVFFDHSHFLLIAQVGLLQNEDHVLEPFLVHESEQLPGRRAPGIHDRKDKKNEVGPGMKFSVIV